MKTEHEYNFVFKYSIMTKHGSNSNPDDDPTLLPGLFIQQSSSFHLASIGTRMAINQQNYHHPSPILQIIDVNNNNSIINGYIFLLLIIILCQ